VKKKVIRGAKSELGARKRRIDRRRKSDEDVVIRRGKGRGEEDVSNRQRKSSKRAANV